MESKITISFDYEQKTPFIKVAFKNSDDERDRMVKAFLESMGGDICFAKFHYQESYDPTITVAAIRPIPYNNLKEEIRAMDAWVDHVQGDVLKDDYLKYIDDNSNAFTEFLDKEGIKWTAAGHSTGVPGNINLYNLGVKWGIYKAQNDPSMKF
jgi:hypothetical protein